MAKSALKFKDSVAAYEKLAQEIAARRFAPVYLLMGEESYFIDAIAERLATTVLGEAERAFNQITVYGKDSEAGQVINLCRQMPMMGSYQVVILKEAQQLKGIEVVQKTPPPIGPGTSDLFAADLRTQRAQLFFDALIAAVDVGRFVNLRHALGHQARHHQRRARPQVGDGHRRAVEFAHALNEHGAVHQLDMRAHAP